MLPALQSRFDGIEQRRESLLHHLRGLRDAQLRPRPATRAWASSFLRCGFLAVVIALSGCDKSTAPDNRGDFEATLTGFYSRTLSGSAGFAARTDISAPEYWIIMEMVQRDTAWGIQLSFKNERPAPGSYTIRAEGPTDTQFSVMLTSCALKNSWCSAYGPVSGLVTIVESTPSKVTGQFVGRVEQIDASIFQEVDIDASFTAVCNPAVLHPIPAVCR